MEQAVILAGGQATRMRPYTDDRPKALVEVAGKAIIVHQIGWLVSNGVTNVVVSCGYKAEAIEHHLGDGTPLGVSITYAVEDEPLGRGGGLRYAAASLADPSARWLAINGDVVCDFSIAELEAQHSRQGATATIALAAYRSNWGIAKLDGDLIQGFEEKPVLPYWINAGVYCFEPEVAALLPHKGDHEDTTFPALASEGRLYGYRIEGYWRGIDTAKDIKEASEELTR